MNIFRKASLLLIAVTAFAASAFTLDLPTETINGKTYYVYRVAPKETVYSITRKLGITRDELIAANPAVADGLRAGDTLIFPADGAQAVTAKVAEPVVETPKEPEKAEAEVAHATTEPEKKAEEKPEVQPALPQAEEIAEETAPATPAAPVVTVENSNDAETDTISVAVILPFMLESENLTKSAENITNFYRGFMLGIDSLATDVARHVNIMAFDSEGSATKVNELMAQPAVANAGFIIAPDDASSIDAIAAVTDNTDAMVLNLFAVKNDAHRTHESVCQGNISHDLMYDLAIAGFCNANKGKKVIILNASDIPAEKSSFTSELSTKLVSAGIPYEKLDYMGKLTAQDLAQLTPMKDYVFIPTSHSREALMRILPALEEYKLLNQSTALFGYPEWIVLQGDIKERLHKLNTTIYSRFASDPSSANFKRVAASYEDAYGCQLDKATPVSALLGFDTAAWILQAAERGCEEPYNGIQNSFKFKGIEGGGNENNALYFINFTPVGSTDVILL